MVLVEPGNEKAPRAGGASSQVLLVTDFRGAGDRTRTGDVQLGKLAFYQLNYARVVGAKDTPRQYTGQVDGARLNLRRMTELPATSPPSSLREPQLARAATGAVLGAVVWLECIAFGLLKIPFETHGYNVIPIAAVAGGLLGMTPMRRVLWAAAAGLALVLGVVAYTPIMRRPARALVRADTLGARPVQAVAVLSGRVTADGYLGDQSLDRLLTGLALVQRGTAGTLMLSRVRSNESAATSDADQRRLIALLEHPVRILVVDSVYSTRDEAVRMRALAQSLGISSIALVTSPMHTHRACATFEKVGFLVTCVPSESRDVAVPRLTLETDRVRAFQLWLYERAAMAKYRARGWM
jgi:uncharacterized SAM-binding protein YcdF (DUF218 family)